MEHTKSTTRQVPAASATKTVVTRPYAYNDTRTRTVNLPSDAEAFFRALAAREEEGGGTYDEALDYYTPDDPTAVNDPLSPEMDAEHKALVARYASTDLNDFADAVRTLITAERNPAPKTIRFTVEASEDVPFAYSAEVQLPADAEAYCREFIRQMESTTRIAPEDVASNAQAGLRMHDKYGEKKLQSFMHATEALVLAENSPTGPGSDPVRVTYPTPAGQACENQESAPSATEPTHTLYACLPNSQVYDVQLAFEEGEEVRIVLWGQSRSTIGTGYRPEMPEHGALSAYLPHHKLLDDNVVVAQGRSWDELEASFVAWNANEIALGKDESAPSVSEDAPSYNASSPARRAVTIYPRGNGETAPTPTTIFLPQDVEAFFRRLCELSPDGISDVMDYNPETWTPEGLQHQPIDTRDAIPALPTELSLDEQTELEDAHTALLLQYDYETMVKFLDAFCVVWDGEFTEAMEAEKNRATPAQIHPTTYPDHDEVTTVDVILYEEGKPRTVHVVKNVFGFFAQLRHFLAGTLDSYHPEEGVPTRFKEEHARLVALVGIDAMVDGAIAFEVWASRATPWLEKGVIARKYDNRPVEPAAEPDPDDDPDEPWRDLNGNAVPDYEEDGKAIQLALSVLDHREYTLGQMDDCSEEEEVEQETTLNAIAVLEALKTRMKAYAESQKNPNPNNAEHLLCRLTRALAAIGFGDPDAAYDAMDVLNIAEAHWQDMLLVTGIDQPAAETAAEVNAYARTTPADGYHSSDSLDEARAIERADADGSILVNLRDSLAQLGFGTDEEVSGADLTDLLAEFWPSIDAAATAAKGGN